MDATLVRETAGDHVDLGELRDSLGFLMRLAQLQVFENYFAALGPYDMRPGEFSVLVVISRNPGIRQGVLANRLMIKRAHITKMVRGLEDQGLVARRIPDEDRRVVELTLTKKGNAFVAERIDVLTTFDRAVPEGMTRKERDQLVHLLHKFLGLTEASA
ncbi:MarR family winged helix-turn-helix transcriptional regulator [Amorphus orientalis]|uniref:DNA-binding MarR family transcriptional regulator n=1 Tax=Amorphus orientalis TaxID=649198 RepID=A0AAE4AUC6_9HYPH|nr:MarR family transcriptional regulator [Amorphus orientalis]MDQ0317278.1 DNA-binding MarR family transcriptional regulator [Amorphus orientalis]